MSELDLISFCGINCSTCPAYTAKRIDDWNLREKTAKEWSSPEYPVKPEEINCDGCIARDKQLISFCNSCQVRQCGLEKDVQNCAHCEDYVCDKLEELWTMFKTNEAKENLVKIRSKLAS